MRLILLCILVALGLTKVQGQTTITNNLQVKSTQGVAPNQVIPINGGIVFADGNGVFKKTTQAAGLGNVVTTISGLRSTTGITGVTYYTTDMGKEGYWKYDASDATSTDNLGTCLISGSMRFKRVIFGYINATWFGAVGDGSTNNTTAIQAAMDCASASLTTSKSVYLPQGNYLIDSLKLRNGASLFGDNKRTTLTARVSTASGLFVLGDAPVQKITIYGLTCVGNASNVGQHCFNITAVPQLIPAYTGGLWYSTIDNIDISGFKGHGLHFYCSDGLGDMANQFLTINNMHISATADSSSVPFYAEGQFAQANITNCLFDGPNRGNAGTIGIVLKSLLTSNDQVQGAIIFNNITVQSVRKAVFTSFAQGVIIENGWFENDSIGVHATNKSRISIRNNVFKNIGPVIGTYLAGNDNSVVDFIGNGMYGVISGRTYTSPAGQSGGGDISNNYFQDLGSMTTVFTGSNVNLSGNTLNTTYFRDIVTNGTYSKSNYVTDINSSLGPGEFITIRCDDRANPNSFIAFKQGIGNIDLPTSPDSGFVVIRGRGCAIFRRSDLLGTWVLAGLSQPNVYSDTVPQSGSWFTGEIVYNNNPGTGTIFWYCKQGGQPGTWDSLSSKGRPHTVFIPSDGGTVQLVANQYNILSISGSYSTLTLNLPASPSNNDVIYIKSSATSITTLNITGGTVASGIAEQVKSLGLTFIIYDSATNTWH